MKINEIVYEARSKLIENNLINEELDMSLIKTARFISNHFGDISIRELNDIGLFNNFSVENSRIELIKLLLLELDSKDVKILFEGIIEENQRYD